jgi:hypothetical protein
VYGFAQRHAEHTEMVLIEPQADLLAPLKDHYQHHPRTDIMPRPGPTTAPPAASPRPRKRGCWPGSAATWTTPLSIWWPPRLRRGR